MFSAVRRHFQNCNFLGSMGAFPHLPSNIYEFAIGCILGNVRELAGKKNIPLAPDDTETIAETALDSLDLPTIYQLTRVEPEAARLALCAVDRTLDVFAAAKIIFCILHLDRGIQPPGDEVIARAEAMVGHLKEQDDPGRFRTWPDTMESVRQYYIDYPASTESAADALRRRPEADRIL